MMMISTMTNSLQAQPHFDQLRNDPTLRHAPNWQLADGFATRDPNIKAIFFDGKPYKGKPTRVFAYVGIPAHKPGEKVPGMVLMHGGGGTAYENWVKDWNDRGYAAISIDHYGRAPNGGPLETDADPHDMGGPAGSDLTFKQINDPIGDQWPFHAISDVMLAHSLLASLDGVDADRIGVTGISWGGYLTCLVAGVDERFKFAVPVYGCGYVNECSWGHMLLDEQGIKWIATWDPSLTLPHATMPMFFINGTNDGAYFMPAWQKSYRLVKSPVTLSLTLEMPHSNMAGQIVDVIAPYADSIVKGGTPLARIVSSVRNGNEITVRYDATTPIQRAELLYTTDTVQWVERKWNIVAAQLGDNNTVTATLPEGTTGYFINLIDTANNTVSTEHEAIDK
jgi:dienelactone hydrolase